jgi:hypothetical protein
MFLEKYRRNNNGHLTKGNAQRFKSAVLTFRYLNEFEGFSESKQVTFKRFLKV